MRNLLHAHSVAASPRALAVLLERSFSNHAGGVWHANRVTQRTPNAVTPVAISNVGYWRAAGFNGSASPVEPEPGHVTSRRTMEKRVHASPAARPNTNRHINTRTGPPDCCLNLRHPHTTPGGSMLAPPALTPLPPRVAARGVHAARPPAAARPWGLGHTRGPAAPCCPGRCRQGAACSMEGWMDATSGPLVRLVVEYMPE